MKIKYDHILRITEVQHHRATKTDQTMVSYFDGDITAFFHRSAYIKERLEKRPYDGRPDKKEFSYLEKNQKGSYWILKLNQIDSYLIMEYVPKKEGIKILSKAEFNYALTHWENQLLKSLLKAERKER